MSVRTWMRYSTKKECSPLGLKSAVINRSGNQPMAMREAMRRPVFHLFRASDPNRLLDSIERAGRARETSSAHRCGGKHVLRT